MRKAALLLVLLLVAAPVLGGCLDRSSAPLTRTSTPGEAEDGPERVDVARWKARDWQRELTDGTSQKSEQTNQDELRRYLEPRVLGRLQRDLPETGCVYVYSVGVEWTPPSSCPEPERQEFPRPKLNETRYIPAWDPPTQDPPTPYTFDPSLLIDLRRGNDARLTVDDCGSYYEDGQWLPNPCPEPVPPPECDTTVRENRPTIYTDADQDRIFDHFEQYLATLDNTSRVSTVVSVHCHIVWNDILELRERVGHFPVTSVTRSFWFTADLTIEQIEALTEWENVRAVEGNARITISHWLPAI